MFVNLSDIPYVLGVSYSTKKILHLDSWAWVGGACNLRLMEWQVNMQQPEINCHRLFLANKLLVEILNEQQSNNQINMPLDPIKHNVGGVYSHLLSFQKLFTLNMNMKKLTSNNQYDPF